MHFRNSQGPLVFGNTQIQRISVNWNKYCQLGGSNPETLSLYHLGFQFKGLIAVWLLVLKKKVVQSSNRNKLFNHTHFGSHTKSKDQFTSRIHYNSIASEPIFIGCCFVVLPNFRAHRRPSKLSWQAQDPFLPKRPIQNLRSRHIKKRMYYYYESSSNRCRYWKKKLGY